MFAFTFGIGAAMKNYKRIKTVPTSIENPQNYSIKERDSVENHTIAIIIPVYNAEPWLCECLDSCIWQTYEDVRIICVNDGSTDKSLEILTEYRNKNKDIIIIDQPNQGVSKARNVGTDKAVELGAKYILYVDSDDWMDLDACTNAINVLEQFGADVVVFGLVVNSDEGVPDQYKVLVYKDPIDAMTKNENVRKFCHNRLYKTSIIGDVRFPKIAYAEDTAFNQVVMLKSTCLAYANIDFYHYRHHEGSLNSQGQNVILDAQIDEYNFVTNEVRRLGIDGCDNFIFNKMMSANFDCIMNAKPPEFRKKCAEKILKNIGMLRLKENELKDKRITKLRKIASTPVKDAA